MKELNGINDVDKMVATSLISKNSQTDISNTSTSSSSATTQTVNFLDSPKLEIKKQFFIDDTGHFKYLNNNAILINFIDKVKLYVDENSVDMYVNGIKDKCFCSLYLPDNSQHEICLGAIDNLTDYFKIYLNFMEQWFEWLVQAGTIQMKNVETRATNVESVNFNNIRVHLNELKLFNFKMQNDLGLNNVEKSNNYLNKEDSNTNKNISLMSVSSLMNENRNFLKNISNSK